MSLSDQSTGKENTVPPPSDVVSESATDKGRRDSCHGIGGAYEALISRSFRQRRDSSDSDQGAAEDARGTGTGNGTTDDENSGVWSYGGD